MPARLPHTQAKIAAFDQAVSLQYLAGLSSYEIAELRGCSHGKIAHSLRRSKTPMRTTRETKILQEARPA